MIGKNQANFSRVHISQDEVFFQDSEETIHGVEINDISYESQADFHWEKPNNQKPKKYHFPAPPILNIFLSKFQGLVLG